MITCGCDTDWLYYAHLCAQSLFIPVQVDILLIGFDTDGAYSYSLDPDELEEALSKAHSEKEICPTILETEEQAAVCFNVNYLMLAAPVDVRSCLSRGMLQMEPDMLTDGTDTLACCKGKDLHGGVKGIIYQPSDQ